MSGEFRLWLSWEGRQLVDSPLHISVSPAPAEPTLCELRWEAPLGAAVTTAVGGGASSISRYGFEDGSARRCADANTEMSAGDGWT